MEQERKIDVMIAEACHEEYVDIILDTIEAAAKVRGTGIAKRTHEYVAQKMKEGKAVIALEGNKFAGFSYIESWGNKQYVTTSGLIVHPDFRGLGIAKRIKEMTFQLARMRWPHAKIFSLTSGAAVMKMNTELGYVPVTFAEMCIRDRAVLTTMSSNVPAAVTASAPECFSIRMIRIGPRERRGQLIIKKINN